MSDDECVLTEISAVVAAAATAAVDEAWVVRQMEHIGNIQECCCISFVVRSGLELLFNIIHQDVKHAFNLIDEIIIMCINFTATNTS